MAVDFKLKILTPSGTQVDQNVLGLMIKTSTGYITILAKHAPLISIVETSFLYFFSSDKATKHEYVVGRGIIKVENNIVTLTTDLFMEKTRATETPYAIRDGEISKALKASVEEKDLSLEKMGIKLEDEISKISN